MEIIHVAAEIAPIAKVGGLGDVLYGLSRALLDKNQEVTVIIPKYHTIDIPLTPIAAFDSQFNGKKVSNTLFKGRLDGIKLLLIEPHHRKKWFARGEIYGEKDDLDRFLYFCRATFDYLMTRKELPDILHLHDWHTSALAPLMRQNLTTPPKILTTVHNFCYQGHCPKSALKSIGLEFDPSFLDTKHKAKVNLLKCGLLYSDYSNTVSPSYAKEAVTTSNGCGLQRTLKSLKGRFNGILNGIDYDYWNPRKDPLLLRNFSAKSLQLKSKSKELLAKQLRLAQDERPLVAIITRLVPQKGIAFIKEALKRIPSMGGQCVLLGSSPIPKVQKEFEKLEKLYQTNPHLHLSLKYDETLSHALFGAADILLVPSLFEPCGLTQMIALHYGTVPLVRHTGGLADTVVDIDESRRPFSKRNGYSFQKATKKAFTRALTRAFDRWYDNSDSWKKLQNQGMRQNFSWKTAAGHYLALYRKKRQL